MRFHIGFDGLSRLSLKAWVANVPLSIKPLFRAAFFLRKDIEPKPSSATSCGLRRLQLYDEAS
jgi:hypothetical protein